MERTLEPEIMDDPELEDHRHRHALHGLARLNWLSGSANILWPSIHRLSQQRGNQTLRILDVATGSGSSSSSSPPTILFTAASYRSRTDAFGAFHGVWCLQTR